MKKIIFFTTLFFLVQLHIITAQNKTNGQISIVGEVIDSLTNETIPFSTITIADSNQPQKVLKKVAADIDGKFKTSLTVSSNMLITAESTGMKSKTIKISSSEIAINVGKIALTPIDKLLTEITVTASKPLVKVDLDKIVYDMKSDPESETSTTLDMLRKVPLITVDGDENIQVKGQSNFKILMNGKSTNIISNNPSQVLKSIPANTIKNIEVITEPGAKYEAEGLAGIINIITESTMRGYTGTVRAGVDNYGAINGGVYFSTKLGKWGITTNLNQGMFKSPGTLQKLDRESFADSPYKYLNQESEGNNVGKFQYGSLSVGYEIDSLNLLTLNGNLWGHKFNSNRLGSTWIHSNLADTTQSYNNKTVMEGLWANYSTGIDYQRSFKKPEKLLTASYQLGISPNNSDNISEITSVKNYFDSKQHIKSEAAANEHTFQLDFTTPLNKKHVLEVGGKYIYRINKSENEYLNFNYSNNQWETNSLINEKGIFQTYGVLGIYGSYTYKLNKISFRAGGRLEQTNGSIQNSDTLFKSPTFRNLVPSITISYRVTPASNIQLSYTQRVSRPDIYFLNPFKNVTDPKNIVQGNPHLTPEISNSINLNYNLFTQKFNFNASAFTAFANNSIEQINELQDTIVYTTFKNIGNSKNGGISSYLRWQMTKDLNIYFNGTGRYMYYSFENNNELIENDGFVFSGHLGGSYSLPKEFRINFNSGYSTQNVTLQGNSNGYYYYSLSLNKNFLQKKLTVTANANGFLEKYVSYKSSVVTDTYRSTSIMSRQSPRFGITVSYRFGEMKEQIKQVKRGIQNTDVKQGEQGGGTGQQGSEM